MKRTRGHKETVNYAYLWVVEYLVLRCIFTFFPIIQKAYFYFIGSTKKVTETISWYISRKKEKSNPSENTNKRREKTYL